MFVYLISFIGYHRSWVFLVMRMVMTKSKVVHVQHHCCQSRYKLLTNHHVVIRLLVAPKRSPFRGIWIPLPPNRSLPTNSKLMMVPDAKNIQLVRLSVKSQVAGCFAMLDLGVLLRGFCITRNSHVLLYKPINSHQHTNNQQTLVRLTTHQQPPRLVHLRPLSIAAIAGNYVYPSSVPLRDQFIGHHQQVLALMNHH